MNGREERTCSSFEGQPVGVHAFEYLHLHPAGRRGPVGDLVRRGAPLVPGGQGLGVLRRAGAVGPGPPVHVPEAAVADGPRPGLPLVRARERRLPGLASLVALPRRLLEVVDRLGGVRRPVPGLCAVVVCFSRGGERARRRAPLGNLPLRLALRFEAQPLEQLPLPARQGRQHLCDLGLPELGLLAPDEGLVQGLPPDIGPAGREDLGLVEAAALDDVGAAAPEADGRFGGLLLGAQEGEELVLVPAVEEAVGVLLGGFRGGVVSPALVRLLRVCVPVVGEVLVCCHAVSLVSVAFTTAVDLPTVDLPTVGRGTELLLQLARVFPPRAARQHKLLLQLLPPAARAAEPFHDELLHGRGVTVVGAPCGAKGGAGPAQARGKVPVVLGVVPEAVEVAPDHAGYLAGEGGGQVGAFAEEVPVEVEGVEILGGAFGGGGRHCCGSSGKMSLADMLVFFSFFSFYYRICVIGRRGAMVFFSVFWKKVLGLKVWGTWDVVLSSVYFNPKSRANVVSTRLTLWRVFIINERYYHSSSSQTMPSENKSTAMCQD